MTTETTTTLPTWAEMSDLDKGAALLHLYKRGSEGAEYAEENYPAEYLDHPALTALGDEAACKHAASLNAEAWALDPGEFGRLYDLALTADQARWKAQREAATAAEPSRCDHGPDERCFECATDDEMAAAVPDFPMGGATS